MIRPRCQSDRPGRADQRASATAPSIFLDDFSFASLIPLADSTRTAFRTCSLRAGARYTRDPDGGFVTGGHWINSPSRACTPDDPTDEDVIGKANFGFVSKYKRGATPPTGNTEFNFKSGDLNFHSDAVARRALIGADGLVKVTLKLDNGGCRGGDPEYNTISTVPA